MKKKIMALILTVAMSVMSSIPVLAAQDGASYYDSNCYKCGEWATTFTVIGSSTEDIDAKVCEHGHPGEADVLRVRYDRVRYYCADCNFNWEQDEFWGMAWCCTYDD